MGCYNGAVPVLVLHQHTVHVYSLIISECKINLKPFFYSLLVYVLGKLIALVLISV